MPPNTHDEQQHLANYAADLNAAAAKLNALNASQLTLDEQKAVPALVGRLNALATTASALSSVPAAPHVPPVSGQPEPAHLPRPQNVADSLKNIDTARGELGRIDVGASPNHRAIDAMVRKTNLLRGSIARAVGRQTVS